jgi:hypothetical protein
MLIEHRINDVDKGLSVSVFEQNEFCISIFPECVLVINFTPDIYRASFCGDSRYLLTRAPIDMIFQGMSMRSYKEMNSGQSNG